MRTTFISRFTPSLMAPDDLERMLVDPQGLVPRLVSLFAEGVPAGNLPRVLLVGARGSGKTHLLTVTAHRLQAHLASAAVWVWLREEEWGIESFLDLQVRMLRRLAEQEGGGRLRADLERLYELPPGQRELAAGELLAVAAGDRPFFLLLENLQDLFVGLKETGQRKFRAFLQEQRVALLATTPALDESVTKRSFPFFGFFDTYHLSGLDAEEARLLLVRLARLKGDEDLAVFLEGDDGLRRVKVINHLAGGGHSGNPRLYVVLSGVINHEKLDQLVPAVLDMLDDLTPYYQARMNELPVQQRKLVEYLAHETDRPIPVKLLAQRTFIAQNTASKQLEKLLARGFVAREQVGRESLYELREPFMRLCFRVKEDRGRPVELIVEFLRLWFGRDELASRLASLSADDAFAREYLTAALRRCEAFDWQKLREPAAEVTTIEEARLVLAHRDEAESGKLIQAAARFAAADRFDEAFACCDAAEARDGAAARAALLLLADRDLEALEAARAAVRQVPEPEPALLLVLATAAARTGTYDEAGAAVAALCQRRGVEVWSLPFAGEVVRRLLDAGRLGESAEMAGRWLHALGSGPSEAAAAALLGLVGDRPAVYRACRRRLGALARQPATAEGASNARQTLAEVRETHRKMERAAREGRWHVLAGAVSAGCGWVRTAPELGVAIHWPLRIAARHDGLPALGAALVSLAIADLRSEADRGALLAGWPLVAPVLGRYDELAPACRLIGAAVEYTRTGSRRPLLELAREERMLLMEELGLAGDAALPSAPRR